ncbi:myosin-8-like [Stylophora pistillata]|uniref:myosin-8-like n=1 Tax=Stylophora pistillata TaxID=50429 RepID=UPI000C0472EC|nr:myosin-8-like [Stylophora pistillata]
MWYDSFSDSEPFELSQVNLTTSYQPHFQFCAWFNNDSTEHEDNSLTLGPYLSNYPNEEQTSFTTQQQQLDLNTNLSCSPEKKSEIVTKIQNFRSENVILDEDIEEQKRRNSLLLQRIKEAQEQLNTVQQTTANLYNECQSVDEKCERFSKQLDEETRELTEAVEKKRRNISEIKVDAELVATLREEKDRSFSEIARLRDDLMDAEIDVDNLTMKFQYALGKMVIFPFWRLEEEIDKVLQSCGVSSAVEESSSKQVVGVGNGLYHHEKSASGSNENSERSSVENSDGNSEEETAEILAESSSDLHRCSKESLKDDSGESLCTDDSSDTSQITVIKVNMMREGDRSVGRSSSVDKTISTQSTFPSAHEGCVKTCCEFADNFSLSHEDAPKKPPKKSRKSSRLAFKSRFLRCVPKRNEDK